MHEFGAGFLIGLLAGAMVGWLWFGEAGERFGRSRLCEEWNGVIVEGKCVARDSLREVKP